MPVFCRLHNGKWRAQDNKGKVHGTHETEKACKQQARAINANISASQAVVYNSPEECTGFLILDTKTNTFEKEIIYPGQFEAKGNKFTVDEGTLQHWASETNKMIGAGVEVPVPLEHTNDPEKNRGFVTGFSVRENSNSVPALFAKVQFRDAEAAKMASSTNVSLFSPPEYKDGKGNRYVRPIRHVALTNYPVIPGLDGFEPIAASLVSSSLFDEVPSMAIKDLAAKLGLKLSEDVLSDENQTSEAIFSAITEDHDTFVKLQEDHKTLQLSFDDYKKNHPKKTKVEVSDAQIEMFAENRQLKLSHLVDQGKITPAVKQKLENVFCGKETLTLCLSENVNDRFNDLIDALADNDPVKLGEKTGPQTADILELSKVLSSDTNPLLADAERRAKAGIN